MMLEASWRRRALSWALKVGWALDQEGFVEEGTAGRDLLQQKGPSHTLVWQPHPSPHLLGSLTPGAEWFTQVSTLTQKCLYLIVRAGSGKMIKLLKFIRTIIHFPVSSPPSWPAGLYPLGSTGLLCKPAKYAFL